MGLVLTEQKEHVVGPSASRSCTFFLILIPDRGWVHYTTLTDVYPPLQVIDLGWILRDVHARA